jgi:hypothetical protein
VGIFKLVNIGKEITIIVKALCEIRITGSEEYKKVDTILVGSISDKKGVDNLVKKLYTNNAFDNYHYQKHKFEIC